MAEWLYEEGIGENRAIRIERGEILEAAIELPTTHRVGAVVDGRLSHILIAGRRGIVTLDGGSDALIEPMPPKLTEGARLRVEVLRDAIPEARRAKLVKVRPSEAPIREGPSLHDRLTAGGARVTLHAGFGADRFEEAGWSELVEQAVTGEIPFPAGGLRMSVTPAMTLFDVDGTLPAAELAAAGAAAAARSILRFGIGGSIGIDLPTLPGRAERHAAAAALDAVLPQPFERTAVNGFGFLQIVRRRERMSIPELLLGDQAAARARALLRMTERSAGAGERIITAAPAVVERIAAHPEWIAQLQRRIGAPVALRAEPGLAISAGHVHSSHA